MKRVPTRVLATVAVFASLAGVSGEDIAPLERLQQQVDAAAVAMFDSLGAEPARCPESYAEAPNWDGRSMLLCGHTALGADELRVRREEILSDLLGAGLTIEPSIAGGTSWVTPAKRTYDVRALALVLLPVQLVVDIDRGNVAIAYPADIASLDGRFSAVDPGNRGQRITLPKSIEKGEPVYPELARQARLTGQVILQLVVTRSGTVENVEVVRVDKPNIGFEQAAVAACRQWRFEPATIGDTPVDVYATVRVDFNLR